MLDPYDRRLLKETLRPPDGFSLDCAVGTSYSLDLLALLTTLAAFGIFESENEAGEVDSLALLGALRRHAKDIHVFCQADRILVPKRADRDRLFISMEKMILPVRARGPQNSFHPKIWVIRYRNGEELFFRLLCSTRNMTFDRSWDLFLVLESRLSVGKSTIPSNEPLADFIGALPGMALREVPNHVSDRILGLGKQLRHVNWEPPKDFNSVAFQPLGTGKRESWPFEGKSKKLLVISPFLEKEFLERLVPVKGKHFLISRIESLDKIPKANLDRFGSVFTLDPSTELGVADDTPQEALSGLHAKLYVEETESEVRLLVGSGNATNAAFHGNTEFFVELRGPRRICGIETILGSGNGAKGAIHLRDILVTYSRKEMEVKEGDSQREINELINQTRWILSGFQWKAQVSPPDKTHRYGLCLNIESDSIPVLPENVKVHSWPVTLPENAAVLLKQKGPVVADFGKISLEALTSFFAFRLSVTLEEEEETVRFVLNLPLTGAPADREERILRTFLSNKMDVLRFLWLLLDLPGAPAISSLSEIGPWQPGGPVQHLLGGGQGLLERLLRVLDRDPDRLKDVEKIVGDLKQIDGGKDLLPDNFESIWGPVWEAYQGLGK
jgi:hypothetical protein